MIFREQPENDAFWRRTGPAAPFFLQKAGASIQSTVWVLGEPALVWQIQRMSEKQGTAFVQTLAHQQDQAIAVSRCSVCRGSCGTWCEKWAEAGAAVVPLLAPGLVSWG